MSRGERKAMIRRDHPGLSLSRQCGLLSISRSSFYYATKGESAAIAARRRKVAIMDWATRHVLAWRLLNTMDAGFCVEALNEALSSYQKELGDR